MDAISMKGVRTDLMDMGDGYIVAALRQEVEDGEFLIDYWTDGFESTEYFDLSVFWRPKDTNFNKHYVLPTWMILG